MKWMLLLAAAVVAAPASAMDFAALVRELRAHQAKVVQEIGDLKIVQNGSFTASVGSTVEATMWRKGAKWRTDTVMTSSGAKGGRMETLALFDGTDLWSVSMGMKTKLPRGQPAQGALFWNEPPPGSQVVGSETIDGRTCWVVEQPAPAANPMVKVGATRLWIDKVSFMTVRTESKLSGKTVRTTFSDFRRIKGHDFPHAATVTSDGRTTMATKVASIETNLRLADDLFDPARLPGAAAAGGMDLDAAMKRAEEMRKRAEAMQKSGAVK